jgi:hypothetical protein
MTQILKHLLTISGLQFITSVKKAYIPVILNTLASGHLLASSFFN